MLCVWSMVLVSGRISVSGTKLSCWLSVFTATDCIDVGQYSRLAPGNKDRALTKQGEAPGMQAGIRALA